MGARRGRVRRYPTFIPLGATSERTGVIVLTTLVEPEGDKYVSWCEELGTASCGDTVEEAFANILEAVEVHLNGLEESGRREGL